MNGSLTITTLVDQWRILGSRIASLEAELELLKSERMEIENSGLVNALAQMGASSWTDSEGNLTVSTDRFITARPVEGGTVEACDFLDKSGYGSIIKTELKFQKGEDISEVEGLLEERGVSYEKDVNVHFKSFEKAIRTIIEESEIANPDVDVRDIIPESINVKIFTKATIKENRK